MLRTRPLSSEIIGATDILTMPLDVASVASCVLVPTCVPVLPLVPVATRMLPALPLARPFTTRLPTVAAVWRVRPLRPPCAPMPLSALPLMLRLAAGHAGGQGRRLITSVPNVRALPFAGSRAWGSIYATKSLDAVPMGVIKQSGSGFHGWRSTQGRPPDIQARIEAAWYDRVFPPAEP